MTWTRRETGHNKERREKEREREDGVFKRILYKTCRAQRRSTKGDDCDREGKGERKREDANSTKAANETVGRGGAERMIYWFFCCLISEFNFDYLLLNCLLGSCVCYLSQLLDLWCRRCCRCRILVVLHFHLLGALQRPLEALTNIGNLNSTQQREEKKRRQWQK